MCGCYVILCNVKCYLEHDVLLCYVLLCYLRLSCDVLCYLMLSYGIVINVWMICDVNIMWCHVMLCYVMLYVVICVYNIHPLSGLKFARSHRCFSLPVVLPLFGKSSNCELALIGVWSAWYGYMSWINIKYHEPNSNSMWRPHESSSSCGNGSKPMTLPDHTTSY